MKTIADWKNMLSDGLYAPQLALLYGCPETQTQHHAQRYIDILSGLETVFGPHERAALFSAPGRTEIGGNHTDHQNGCVLAASVNIDMTGYRCVEIGITSAKLNINVFK